MGPVVLLPFWWLWNHRRNLPILFQSSVAKLRANPTLGLALLLLLIPCAENLLLSKHALVYSFDRVKVCSALIILASILPFFTTPAQPALRPFSSRVAVICLLNLAILIFYAAKIYRDRNEQGLKTIAAANYVRTQIPEQQRVIVNENVRAAFLYYAGRNVAVELNSIPDPVSYLQQLPPVDTPAHLVIPDIRRAYSRNPSTDKVQCSEF